MKTFTTLTERNNVSGNGSRDLQSNQLTLKSNTEKISYKKALLRYIVFYSINQF